MLISILVCFHLLVNLVSFQGLQYQNLEEDDVLDKNLKLKRVLTRENEYTVNVANRLFGEETFDIKQVSGDTSVIPDIYLKPFVRLKTCGRVRRIEPSICR